VQPLFSGIAINITPPECATVPTHSACNAHAPYYLLPAPLYNIFPHDLLNSTIFEKSYWIQIACVDFLYKVCPEHFSF
jgi:hypothetical protein